MIVNQSVNRRASRGHSLWLAILAMRAGREEVALVSKASKYRTNFWLSKRMEQGRGEGLSIRVNILRVLGIMTEIEVTQAEQTEKLGIGLPVKGSGTEYQILASDPVHLGWVRRISTSLIINFMSGWDSLLIKSQPIRSQIEEPKSQIMAAEGSRGACRINWWE